MKVQHPSSTTTIFLDQPPSCLQFCPATPNNLVIGTYLLSETKTNPNPENKDTHSDEAPEPESIQQSKTGSLQLWNLNPESNSLSLITKLHLPHAVFDLHFHPTHPRILGVATSSASVSLFSVSESEITHLWTRAVHEDSSVPALFLAWMPENWLRGPNEEGEGEGFAVTFSDGRTSVFASESRSLIAAGKDEESIKELATFTASSQIEVWFVALACFPTPHTPHPSTSQEKEQEKEKEQEQKAPYLFTGTDFGSLHSIQFEPTPAPAPNTNTSLHQELQLQQPEPVLGPIISLTDDKARHHTAGVTSILPLPLPLSLTETAPLLLTGSYDEYIRVYHATTPGPGRGRGGAVLAEMGLGGGVWRLQLLNSGEQGAGAGGKVSFLVLASCMHAGARVVRVDVSFPDGNGDGGLGAEIDVVAEFTEHQSMNYASDVWRGGKGSGGEVRVVSSSFYDRRVCVWSFGL